MNNKEIEQLKQKIENLSQELEKTNIIGNKNMPILVKYFFVFLFFLIMGFLKPDLILKIIEIIVKAIGT